jgi:NitT/TauT family transport system ATP-binding protein
MDKKPHQLSGGMKQRVAIAQVLILRPSILLMDEPFGALDPQTREVLQILVIKLHEREKNTIFFVTHDLEEAVYVAERVIVLSQYNHNGNGARIVKDVRVPVFQSTEAKRTGDFGGLIQDIRHAGFAPEQREVIDTFNQARPTEGAHHAQK